MRLILSQPYKSFAPPLNWTIPQFAFLTGPNGAGKTQLIDCLHLALKRHSGFKITDERIHQREHLYLKSGWELPPYDGHVTHDQIAGTIRDAATQVKAHYRPEDPLYNELVELRAKISESAGRDYKSLSDEELQRHLPYYGVERIAYGAELAYAHLAHSIYRYHLRNVSLVYHNRTITNDEIEATLGRPPWIAVNELLTAVGVRHQVTSPDALHFDQAYRLKMVDPNGTSIPTGDLSSGERFLTALAILLFNCRQEGRPPKVLIMDEPDAHLHPAVIKHVVTALREIGKEFQCRIIATTHRPDTIATCEPNEICEVFPDGDRVRPCTSKADVISRLSANLLAVLPNTRCVLVEDDEDASFYRCVTAMMVQHYSISLQPLPIFQPACAGSGRTKDAGGKTVVANWVRKLAEAKLDNLVVGLIDWDAGNKSTDGIFVTSRYSIENFLFDPLIVFCRLIDEGVAPVAPGIKVSRGDENQIRKLPPSDLQRIADAVLDPVSVRIASASNDRFDVKFTSGQTLSYPAWLRDLRGHDLRKHYFAAYEKLGTINDMLKALERLRMIPNELVDTIASLSK